mmetsp:Transcript_5501/g.16898  ORF Transcript_5501/g.16898 Transcript_5501/m.16898 type:complete len:93 (+) Transcript_5501:417-695(+)
MPHAQNTRQPHAQITHYSSCSFASRPAGEANPRHKKMKVTTQMLTVATIVALKMGASSSVESAIQILQNGCQARILCPEGVQCTASPPHVEE